MGEIDDISTNTSKYTTCCAANVYIFIYTIFIGAPIVPLSGLIILTVRGDHKHLCGDQHLCKSR